MTVIENVEMARLITLYHALRLQTKGIKVSRLPLCKIAQSMGLKGKNAKELVSDIQAKFPELRS
jgi:hypothetical protein